MIPRLNGWHRLFIVTALSYFGLLTIVALTGLSQHPHPNVAINNLWKDYFYWWLVPMAVLYTLGSAVGWVRRGFAQPIKTGNDNLEQLRRTRKNYLYLVIGVVLLVGTVGTLRVVYDPQAPMGGVKVQSGIQRTPSWNEQALRASFFYRPHRETIKRKSAFILSSIRQTAIMP